MNTDKWPDRSSESSSVPSLTQSRSVAGDSIEYGLSESDFADLYQPRTLPGRRRKKKEGRDAAVMNGASQELEHALDVWLASFQKE